MTGKIVSIIPARKGSKGIPRKNLRQLGNLPLVAHVIETSKKSDIVDHVALTTDSSEIAQIGRQYGVDSIIDRPKDLATDDVPLAPVTKHALDEVNNDFRYVLSFQPTVPLISVESIDEGLNTGLNRDSKSVVFVKDSTHNYWKEAPSGYKPVSEGRKNRQLMDSIYEEVGVFLSHCDLIEDGLRIGEDPHLYQVSRDKGIDIDTYSDWLLAESQLQRKQVIYRVIGNESAGTGHVYRGITIADHLFAHDILFAVESKDSLAIEMLNESNYDYRIFNDETSFIEYIQSESPDIVVNDILDTSAEYIKDIQKYATRVVNFEDLGTGSNYADAVINALYEHSNPLENRFFGFEYFCLRNEFRYATPHSEIPTVERIMISFGGGDENNLTAKTLRALSNLDHKVHLDVVLGLGYSKRETLDPIISQFPSDIQVDVSQNIDSMAEHMEQADLLVTSNGRTLYEAGSLNLPVISIAQNDREQKHPYAHISRGVLSLGLADYVTEENIRTAIKDYIDDRSTRQTMRNALENHNISKGVERIKQILFENNYGNK
ncbi:N-acylneuraminate cytidylyltransferase protein [Halorhabdus tiamatea SARL4B]|uniref:N-acetylneuraminate cytidylyltransferase n=1 Tax=Halorhabdus tiamatea SARL4B TaxID=1033806 RepID=F7PGC2_9EURY|nr:glycosyltransferase [Halorhabdus tiamatea]ERJ05394.1 N-acylneuraminate cytidylyltransferase protein [Halorhabdus tiamatea SARL4B]CCQ33134.1 N-acetylneuraminate cytidylyltransferase [Halorhabdus tiamatea SARL4B]